MSENQERLLLTVEEAAHRLSICRTTMFTLLRRGDLHAVRIGRLTRIHTAELDRYVSGLASQPSDAA